MTAAGERPSDWSACRSHGRFSMQPLSMLMFTGSAAGGDREFGEPAQAAAGAALCLSGQL
jgi:hypothetical protein